MVALNSPLYVSPKCHYKKIAGIEAAAMELTLRVDNGYTRSG